MKICVSTLIISKYANLPGREWNYIDILFKCNIYRKYQNITLRFGVTVVELRLIQTIIYNDINQYYVPKHPPECCIAVLGEIKFLYELISTSDKYNHENVNISNLKQVDKNRISKIMAA